MPAPLLCHGRAAVAGSGVDGAGAVDAGRDAVEVIVVVVDEGDLLGEVLHGVLVLAFLYSGFGRC